MPVQLEGNGHHRAFWAGTGWAVAGDVQDPGVLEDGGVEARRLFTLGVEPQAGCDLLHRFVLS
jgi:hypothetical protein